MTIHAQIQGSTAAAPPAELAETHFRAALSALDTTHAGGGYGWTAQRQSQFLAAIADGATVADAAQEVGLSRRSAYAFRRRANGVAFHLGWQAAEILARDSLRDELWDRAQNGQSWTTVRDDGERVITTTRHRHDNRLAMAMLTRLENKVSEDRRAHEVRLANHFDGFLTLLESGQAPDDPDDLLDRVDPRPARDTPIGTCESCEPLACNCNEGPVYETDAAGGNWWTDLIAPREFQGRERGRYGEPGYHRELDDDELAKIAHFTGRRAPIGDAATIAAAESARDAWFEAAAEFSCATDVVVAPDATPPAAGDDASMDERAEGRSIEPEADPKTQ